MIETPFRARAMPPAGRADRRAACGVPTGRRTIGVPPIAGGTDREGARTAPTRLQPKRSIHGVAALCAAARRSPPACPCQNGEGLTRLVAAPRRSSRIRRANSGSSPVAQLEPLPYSTDGGRCHGRGASRAPRGACGAPGPNAPPAAISRYRRLRRRLPQQAPHIDFGSELRAST
jgi:hypothetical protein